MNRAVFFAVCTVSGLVALGLLFGTSSQWRLQAYIEYGPAWSLACLLAAPLVLGWFAVRQWRQGGPGLNQQRLQDACMAIALTGLIVLLVPARSFIEHDESMMMATGQRLAHDFSPVLARQGVFAADGTLHVLAQDLDKRGTMFPMMLAVMTWILGPSLDHAFHLNALFAIGVFFLAQRLGRRFGTGRFSWTIPVMLSSFAAFTVTMRGGTFDLASSFFLLWLVHSAAGYLATPSMRHALPAVLAALIVCQLRYETLAVSALSISALMLRAWLAPLASGRNLLLAVAPLLLLPSSFRLAVPFDYEMPGPWYQPWTIRNVPDNFERLWTWLLTPTGHDFGSPVVGLLALLGGLLVLIHRVGTRQWRIGLPQAYLLGSFVVLLLIQMWSFWGQTTLVITTRYFISTAVVVSILAALSLQLLKKWPQWPAQAMAVVVVAVPCYVQRDSLITAPAFQASLLHQVRDSALELLRTHYGDCNVLVVSINGVVMLSRGYGAITPRAYTDAGLPALQRLTGTAVEVAVLAVPTYNGRPALPPEFLANWRSHREFKSSGQGHGHLLLQLWPETAVDPGQCRGRQPLSGFQTHAEFPLKAWEHFRERWAEPGTQ